MKISCLMFAMPIMLAVQSVSAQNNAHLTLSEAYPEAGKPVTLIYDPTGTPLEGKVPEGVVYYLDNKNYPASDLTFTIQGKAYKAKTTIPAGTKAFFVKMYKDKEVDNNGGEGYIYKTYAHQQPVAGAYGSEANLLNSGIGAAFGKINANSDKVLELYKEEFAIHPESFKEYEGSYLMTLTGSKKMESQTLALKLATKLANSNDKEDLYSASRTFRRLKMSAKADSMNEVIRRKFYGGAPTEIETATDFIKEKDPAKKAELYEIFIKKSPEDLTRKNTIQDSYRAQLANAYLEAGDTKGYEKYAARVKDKMSLAMGLNNVAYEKAKKDENLAEDEKLSKRSLEIAQGNVDHPAASPYTSLSQARKDAQEVYDLYADTYAYILYKEHKYAEALPYEKGVYERSKGRDAEINENYANILVANGEYAEAKAVVETAIKAGKSSAPMQEDLKQAYVKLKGNDKGYDEYLASLQNAMKNKLREDLVKEMMNKPAPQFTLKDFNGTPVSLASLKGKIVIVDFWATWCGPCKASFPGMQMAVNKYKDNPNVKFLFIDTWETSDNWMEGAKKYITDNHYTFNVLEDEKGEDGRQSKVISQFDVQGIPTKFVIDQSGNIRFKHVGFSGSAQGIVDDISSMIEMLKPESVASVKAGE